VGGVDLDLDLDFDVDLDGDDDVDVDARVDDGSLNFLASVAVAGRTGHAELAATRCPSTARSIMRSPAAKRWNAGLRSTS